MLIQNCLHRSDQSQDRVRVTRERLLKQPNGLSHRVLCLRQQHYRTRPQDEVERIRIGRTLPQAPCRLGVNKADVERGAHADDDLLLAGREVGDLLVEAVGPELRAGLR